MEFKNQINCTGRDGEERIFKYHLKESEENGQKKWIFMVVPENMQFNEWFELSVLDLNGNEGKVVMMNHHKRPEYIAMGIPERLIEEANIQLDLTIKSSSNKLGVGEYRTPNAEKVWERLVERDLAEYNDETDEYTYIPSLKN